VTALVGFVVSVLVARRLGPVGFADYTLVVLILSTVGFLANPGIYATANYHLSVDKLTHEDVFVLASGSALVAAVAAGAIAFLALEQLSRGPMMNAWLTIRITISAAVAFSVIGISMDGVAVGVGRIRPLARGLVIISCLYGLAITLLWLRYVLTPATTTLAFCLYQIANSILRIYFAWPGERVSRVPDREATREFLAYGLSVYSGRVVSFLSQRLDTYLVLLLAGEVALGFYSVAANLAGQIKLIPMAVGISLMPNIGPLTPESRARRVNEVGQVTFALVLSSCLALALAGWYLIPVLYGDTFAASRLPLLIMLFGVLAIATCLVMKPYFEAIGRPLLPAGIGVLGTVANGMVSLLLIRPYGLIGASIAYTSSYLIQLILVGLAFSKQSQLPPFSVLDLREGTRKGSQLVLALLGQADRSAVADT
jgi:O-antigen/teichoic acid export membrane protein